MMVRVRHKVSGALGVVIGRHPFNSGRVDVRWDNHAFPRYVPAAVLIFIVPAGRRVIP